jgi:hypothetical protein
MASGGYNIYESSRPTFFLYRIHCLVHCTILHVYCILLRGKCAVYFLSCTPLHRHIGHCLHSTALLKLFALQSTVLSLHCLHSTALLKLFALQSTVLSLHCLHSTALLKLFALQSTVLSLHCLHSTALTVGTVCSKVHCAQFALLELFALKCTVLSLHCWNCLL